MAISLLFLIFLISIPLTSATSPSSTMPLTPQDPSPPHQVLILPPILSSLGYITLASALPSLSSPILSSWNGSVTLFAPSDSSLHSCLHSSCTPLCLLRDHIVPGLFPLQSLLSLPFSSKLSTASPGRCLTLTSTSALNSSNPNPKLFVNGLEITKPDLFNNGQVVIHGIQGFIAPLSPFSCLHHVAPPRRVPGLVTGSVVPLMLEENGYGFVAQAMRVKHPELVSLNNMTLSSAPLPPSPDGSFARDFLGQVCSYPSWRDNSNVWRKEIFVFWLLLATNFLNWYVSVFILLM